MLTLLAATGILLAPPAVAPCTSVAIAYSVPGEVLQKRCAGGFAAALLRRPSGLRGVLLVSRSTPSGPVWQQMAGPRLKKACRRGVLAPKLTAIVPCRWSPSQA